MILFKTIHLIQKLIQSSLTFSISLSSKARSSRTHRRSSSRKPYCINLIYKYHACSTFVRDLSCLRKQVSYSLGSQSDIQLNKFTARSIYNGYFGFSGSSLRHQRFSSSWRAMQQYAFGHIYTKFGVLFWVFQKVNYLLNSFFSVWAPPDILETLTCIIIAFFLILFFRLIFILISYRFDHQPSYVCA